MRDRRSLAALVLAGLLPALAGCAAPMTGAGTRTATGFSVVETGIPELQRAMTDGRVTSRQLVVEYLPTGMAECGDLIYAANHGKLDWTPVRELKDIVSGQIPARQKPEDITIFDTIGTGAEDVAMGAYVLKLAKEKGIGVELPIPPPMQSRRAGAGAGRGGR